ncbi:2-hydroxyacylsphingosine 1-beta-galactosyltransferase-like [Branchiostoma floridae x Branchiostoma japonicum]
MTLCIQVLLVGTLLQAVLSARIVHLVPPYSRGSHFSVASRVAEGLADRGHDVTMVLQGDGYRGVSHKYRVEKTKSAFTEDAKEANFQDFLAHTLAGQYDSDMVSKLFGHMVDECQAMLNDEDLFQTMNSSMFDLAVIDPFNFCPYIYVQRLGVRFVVLDATPAFFSGRNAYLPSPPTYVPALSSQLTDKMDLPGRLKNTLLGLVSSAMDSYILSLFDKLRLINGICPDLTFAQMMSRAEFWMFQSDVALDFPRPTMPNVQFVGGLTARPGSPLPQELAEFVEDWEDHGVVVVSFGSVIDNIPDRTLLEKLAEGLASLPQRVVWKFTGMPPSNLGNNTKLMAWLPQNDLLAHPHTRAFVTHAGINGLYEALYHAVPVVGLPMFADQFDNMARMAGKGMGITLDIWNLRPEHLSAAVTKVIQDKRYKTTIDHYSRIHHDQPLLPVDRAVFWIEHVLRNNGGDHMRPQVFNLPWYQRYMLDIFAIIGSFLLTLLLVVTVALRKSVLLLITFGNLLWVSLKNLKLKTE